MNSPKNGSTSHTQQPAQSNSGKASQLVAHSGIAIKPIADAIPERTYQQKPTWDVIELGRPLDHHFLVRLHRRSESRDCHLSKNCFKTLLYLSSAFLNEESQAVDLKSALCHQEKGNVHKAVSHLRRALQIAPRSKELILPQREPENGYRLNVGSIEEGDGFHRCRGCFEPDINAVIDKIVAGMVKRNRKTIAVCESRPAVSNERPFDFVQSQFISTTLIQPGCASELILCDSPSAFQQFTVQLN